MDKGLQRPISKRLRAYADPAAEAMSDGTRLSVLVVLAHEAADALDRAGHLIDPTTQSEAVASARTEGVREGLERAVAVVAQLLEGSLSSPEERHQAHVLVEQIRALIPAPPTLTPAETQNHQATEHGDASI